MNNLEKYSSIAITSLWSPFYEGVYNGRSYRLIERTHLFIITREKIKDISKKKWDFYVTEINVEELEAIYKCRMFAIYNGNKYRVLKVDPNIESIFLLANENEDTRVGWDIDIRDNLITKQINKSEIEDFIVEKQDVYNDFLEYYK